MNPLRRALDNVFGFLKAAPALPAEGDFLHAIFSDVWNRQRIPDDIEILDYFRDTAFACANLNADAVARTRLRLYVRTARGQPSPKCQAIPITKATRRRLVESGRAAAGMVVDEVEDHPVLKLMERPCQQEGVEYLNGFDLLAYTQLYQEIIGSAYWLPDFDGVLGIPSALWILPSQYVTPKRNTWNSRVLDYYEYSAGGRIEKFQPNELIAFRFPSLEDPYIGSFSPLKAAFGRIGLSEKHLAQAQAMLDNRSRMDAVITPGHPDQPLGREERIRLEKRIKAKFSRGGTRSVLIPSVPLKVEPIVWPPKDIGELAESSAAAEQIARVFGVPLSMLNRDANRASSEQGRQQHAKDTVTPRLRRLEGVLNSRLLPFYDPSGRLFFAFDDPVPENVELNAKVRKLNLESNYTTINEERSEDKWDPVPWGDEPWMLATLRQPSEDRPQSELALPPNPKQGQQSDGSKGVRKKAEHQPTGRRAIDGARVKAVLLRTFAEQEDWAIKKVHDLYLKDAIHPGLGPGFWDDFDDRWGDVLRERVQPSILFYYDEGAKETIDRLNFDPEIWSVRPPGVLEAVERAAFRLSARTNRTTQQQLDMIVPQLRREIATGLFQGDTLDEITKRIQGVFGQASEYRASRIAATEATRAVHSGQLEAAIASRQVIGKEWLLSGDPCPVCVSIWDRNQGRLVGLRESFAKVSDDPDYGMVEVPPAHPNCQCGMAEVLIGQEGSLVHGEAPAIGPTGELAEA